MEQEVVLITGASSGIGRETAILLAKTGHIVYGAGRRIDKLESLSAFGVIPLYMDITKEYTCENAIKRIWQEQGSLDILINNAGYGSYGAIEDVPLSEARQQLEVNVFGAMRLVQYVLPIFRHQHRGRIVMISSIAGRVTGPFGGWYHASKYALEALTDALRMETSGTGIKVVLVEPGLVKTDWGHIAADHLESVSQGGPYARLAAHVAAGMHKLYKSRWCSPPAEVAKVVFLAANAAQPQSRYLAGRGAYLILFLHAILPTSLFDALARRVMKKL
ncbi:MAG: oxidoreductase [Acidaminococcus provencensis]|jgi:NAD(P)-dependent dehydrogenase (short-subunit alcohol dehydrogenase family)|uniref:oxidoreductase n=1 Tax=Acidaminococcus TaxID=904 RepID=UPI000CF89F8B|nr:MULTISPECIES: oxidoreductase [Acidaminococcus]MCH4097133.1 oxidoreductase [Acidaminococcus provencensis]RHK02046.1 SDR family NAD(P)-dependent oxidoreductase [Acidaminococcus sp. AM05-11]